MHGGSLRTYRPPLATNPAVLVRKLTDMGAGFMDGTPSPVDVELGGQGACGVHFVSSPHVVPHGPSSRTVEFCFFLCGSQVRLVRVWQPCAANDAVLRVPVSEIQLHHVAQGVPRLVRSHIVPTRRLGTRRYLAGLRGDGRPGR